MKNITKLLSTLILVVIAFAFASCANDTTDSSTSDSNSNSATSTEAISGTYKGTFEDNDEGTCYFIVYIKSDYTWYSQGYGNDSTYTTESDVGTIPASRGATYTRSGNTLSMTVAFGSGNMVETGVTTDNWKTITLTGTFAGSLTRQ